MESLIHAWDYVVLCAGLMLSLGVGIVYAIKDRSKTSASRYYTGDSKLSYFALAASMVVTVESTVMLLGYPAEVYVHGFIFVWSNIGTIFAYIVIFIVTIPLFQPLKLISAFEYLDLRHKSRAFRQFIVVYSCLNMILYSGVITFGTALALSAMIGLPTWTCIVMLVIITVTYTALGGFKAVVAADAVQGMVVFIFAIVLLIYGTIRVGGVQRVIDISQSTGRLDVLDFDPNPLTRHTFWTLVIGGAIKECGVTIMQAYIQRISAAKSVNDARKAIGVTLVAVIVFHLIFMSQGLIAYAYFTDKGFDPLASKMLTNPNQIIPFMVQDMFGHVPGITGLFLAAVCSISISTLSSLLNSISAVLVVDIVKVKWQTLFEATIIRIGKGIVFVSGILCIIIGTQFAYITGPLTQIAVSLMSAMTGPILSVYYLSFFVKFTTVKGLITSTIVSYAFGLWISFGYNFSPGRKRTPWMKLGPTDQCPSGLISNQTMNGNSSAIVMHGPEGVDNLYSISYMYFTLMVLLVAVPIGLIVSWFTRSKEPEAIPGHLMLKVGKKCLLCTPNNAPRDEGENRNGLPIEQTDCMSTRF